MEIITTELFLYVEWVVWGRLLLLKEYTITQKSKIILLSFAWVCISQQWQTKDILQQVLLKLIPDKRKQVIYGVEGRGVD